MRKYKCLLGFAFNCSFFSPLKKKITPNLEHGAPPSVSFRFKKRLWIKGKDKNQLNVLLSDKNAKLKTVVFHIMLSWFQMLHGIWGHRRILFHSLVFHKFLLLYLFFFFFFATPATCGIPGLGIEPIPQQQSKLLQGQHRILNPLCLKGTPFILFLKGKITLQMCINTVLGCKHFLCL